MFNLSIYVYVLLHIIPSDITVVNGKIIEFIFSVISLKVYK